jgi:hypothetical protein
MIKSLSIFFMLITSFAFSQSDWINYVIKEDNRLIVVTVDLQYDQFKPDLKYLVLVGSTIRRHCQKNGYPDQTGIEKADQFSNTIDSVIAVTTDFRKVAMLSYFCKIYDIYYVKDTAQLKNRIASSLKRKFPGKKHSIGFEKDKNWKFYYRSLFPKVFTEEYIIDHEIITQLVMNGDKLEKKRDVRHWLYFDRKEQRSYFIQKIKHLGYKADSLNYIKDLKYPYELMIRKNEFVDPVSVSATTKTLTLLVRMNHGIYDRWDSEVVIEE